MVMKLGVQSYKSHETGMNLDEDITTSDTYTLKSESSSAWTSLPFRIPEAVFTKNDTTTTYGVRFRRSLYSWNNFITFPMPPNSGT